MAKKLIKSHAMSMGNAPRTDEGEEAPMTLASTDSVSPLDVLLAAARTAVPGQPGCSWHPVHWHPSRSASSSCVTEPLPSASIARHTRSRAAWCMCGAASADLVHAPQPPVRSTAHIATHIASSVAAGLVGGQHSLSTGKAATNTVLKLASVTLPPCVPLRRPIKCVR